MKQIILLIVFIPISTFGQVVNNSLDSLSYKIIKAVFDNNEGYIAVDYLSWNNTDLWADTSYSFDSISGLHKNNEYFLIDHSYIEMRKMFGFENIKYFQKQIINNKFTKLNENLFTGTELTHRKFGINRIYGRFPLCLRIGKFYKKPLYIYSIPLLTKDETYAIIKVKYYANPLSAYEGIYILKKDQDKWRVEKFVVDWNS